MKPRLRRGERAERIARGQCPACGAEAAPFLLCWSCRLKPRLTRALARGVKVGALNRSITDHFTLRDRSATTDREWEKWSTPLHLSEGDGRGRPKIRGLRVDVDATLVAVIRHIGRPCTIDEIVSAWGKLRSKRVDPLVGDLGRLIVADAKRARKLAKRATPSGQGAAA